MSEQQTVKEPSLKLRYINQIVELLRQQDNLKEDLKSLCAEYARKTGCSTKKEMAGVAREIRSLAIARYDMEKFEEKFVEMELTKQELEALE